MLSHHWSFCRMKWLIVVKQTVVTVELRSVKSDWRKYKLVTIAWTFTENVRKWIATDNYTIWTRSYTKEGRTQRKMWINGERRIVTNSTKREENNGDRYILRYLIFTIVPCIPIVSKVTPLQVQLWPRGG